MIYTKETLEWLEMVKYTARAAKFLCGKRSLCDTFEELSECKITNRETFIKIYFDTGK